VAVRARSEAGFGLVELMIAMVVLAVGILALVAGLSSGYLALNRAGQRGTAAAMADSQMEKYRGLTYASIGLTFTGTDTTYTSDSACSASTAIFGSGVAACGTASSTYSNGLSVSGCGTTGAACTPVQTSVAGPDGRNYRIDTYIRWLTPTSGRNEKLISVVVRDTGATKEYARVQSSFDQCTGLAASATTC
jgi:prepilin-type N-terminal cleavage/methylation domain-containing protein